jgi:hypothetical protein
MNNIGPRFNSTYEAVLGWNGMYTSTDLTYFMPTFTWERKVERPCWKPKMNLEKYSTNRNVIHAVCSIIPSTWISDDFRYIVVPPTAEFYFIPNSPKSTDFEGFEIPDQDTWAEYDVCCYARHKGCMLKSPSILFRFNY